MNDRQDRQEDQNSRVRVSICTCMCVNRPFSISQRASHATNPCIRAFATHVPLEERRYQGMPRCVSLITRGEETKRKEEDRKGKAKRGEMCLEA